MSLEKRRHGTRHTVGIIDRLISREVNWDEYENIEALLVGSGSAQEGASVTRVSVHSAKR